MDESQKHAKFKKARHRRPQIAWFCLYEIFFKRQMYRDRLVLGTRWEQKLTVNRHVGSDWGDESVPKLFYGNVCATW